MSASLGLVIYSAVKPIFKIYFIIGMGFFLAKRNILPVSTCRDISDLVVTAIMPCLIFNNIVSYLQSSDIKFIGIVFFEGTLLFFMGAMLGLLTHYVCRSPKAWFGGLISVGLFPNISDLPIAYLQTMAKTDSLFTSDESDKGVAYVCIFLAAQVFYQFSLGLFKLVRYDFRDQLAKADAEQEVGGSKLEATSTSSESLVLPKPKIPDATTTYSDDSESIDSADPAELEAKSFSEEGAQTGNTQDIASEKEMSGKNPEEEAEEEPSEKKIHEKETPGKEESQNETSSQLSKNMTHMSGLCLRRRRLSSFVLDNPLHMTRTTDSCLEISEDIGDIIHEYSEFKRLKTHELHRLLNATEDRRSDEYQLEEELPVPTRSFALRLKKNVILTLKNFLAPNSVALIVSLAIAMSPPLKALFVTTSFPMPLAPDEQPPLSFVIDIASYVGAASVPLGLLILGATIARLRVTAIVPGFWKTAVMITACRLIVLPIFGVGLTTGIYKAGWYGDDNLIRFVSVLEYGLPNATALVYFTAFYTDPDSPDHLQMDCLAICLIAQYSVLFISLPFLVTFSLKVSMGF
ncbi:auxin efflux carrier [Metschnikowia bicuspidata var. bicuspidata NRRL YB-4993]|uniref:Auxin efflux carrier n=1 Tax=Metschnikowia bicuspidata var. bicuspidata NRRL YB-4993 TaxID=869754 RepID=A0A1A0HF50_9ASCO|nr:auxin efflux carrier [Metschnikowia bicuspidata var. bicuspidata NRRL YB-4993]OBA22513.1 auxin efflux carrier [Metschnikowia bicuspidata var. bicuspidata NRRL YB-4993]